MLPRFFFRLLNAFTSFLSIIIAYCSQYVKSFFKKVQKIIPGEEAGDLLYSEEPEGRHADERERVTGMRQSKTAMLVKIVVGVLFLFAAVSLAVQGNISSFVCGLVIGGALVAWGLAPYLKTKSGRR